MAKLMNVSDTRWAFYEAMENGSKESMADYFETLYLHYKNRGKVLQATRDKYEERISKTNEIIRKRYIKKSDALDKALKVVNKHPHSSNRFVNGSLVSISYIQQEELKEEFT